MLEELTWDSTLGFNMAARSVRGNELIGDKQLEYKYNHNTPTNVPQKNKGENKWERKAFAWN